MGVEFVNLLIMLPILVSVSLAGRGKRVKQKVYNLFSLSVPTKMLMVGISKPVDSAVSRAGVLCSFTSIFC